MTELEWMTCTHPPRMLQFLLGKASERKWRLYFCACSRLLGSLLVDRRSWQAIEVVERYVDGLATRDELAAADHDACDVAHVMGEQFRIEWNAADLSLQRRVHAQDLNDPEVAAVVRRMNEIHAAWFVALTTCEDVINRFTATRRSSTLDETVQCDLLWEIFFLLPFQKLSLGPGRWTEQRSDVLRQAQAIYDEKSFERLPVLASALEDAGCQETTLLTHFRQPGGHVRGCWALDLLMGRE